MRKTIKLAALLLTLHCAFVAARARSEAAPIYYLWFDLIVFFLWRSEADAGPVRASLGQNGVATLEPAAVKNNEEWAAVLRAKLPNVLPDGDPWAALIRRLRDEQPNDDWAKVKPPDLQVYLRTRTAERVLLTYLKNGAATTVSLRKRDGRWEADRPELLAQLARESQAETQAVLGTRDAQTNDASLLQAWGAWADRLLNGQPGGKALIVTRAGGSSFVWQERLSDAEWYRRANLLGTGAAQQPQQQQPQQQQPQQQQPPADNNDNNTQPFYAALWFRLLVITIVVALLLLGWSRNWFSVRRRLTRGRRGASAVSAKRRRFQERGGKVIGPENDGRALEGAVESYLDSFSKNFRQFMSQLNEQMERERGQLLKESGLNGLEPGEARDRIKLGEAAADCFSSLVTLQATHGGERTKLFPMSRNSQQWLSELPESIKSAAQEIREKSLKADRLGDEVKSKIEIIDGLAREMKAVEQERNGLLKTQSELEKKLEEATRKGEDTQVVVEAIGRAIEMANSLQQGLRYFLDQKNDPAAAAVISALVNYSLSRLCRGYLEDDDELVDAMLVNLYTISGRLEDVYGFGAVVQEMEKSYTGIKSLHQRLVKTDRSHADDRMFQAFLKHLREQGQIDLAPFYFAVDQEKKVHYAN
jgi:hypothetical protein